MKIILGVIILILSTGIGYYFSIKYVKIKNFYNNFNSFNKVLITEVAFSQNTLISILNKFNSENNDFLLNLKLYLKDNYSFNLNLKYLTNDEKNFVTDYFANIGKTEKNSQLDFLKKVDLNLENKRKESALNEKKYKNLYIKMGFLIGLIIFVLML